MLLVEIWKLASWTVNAKTWVSAVSAFFFFALCYGQAGHHPGIRDVRVQKRPKEIGKKGVEMLLFSRSLVKSFMKGVCT